MNTSNGYVVISQRRGDNRAPTMMRKARTFGRAIARFCQDSRKPDTDVTFSMNGVQYLNLEKAYSC